MSNEQLVKLIFLSLLWGASFLFIGIAVQELEPLLVVTVRVLLGALTMLFILRLLKGSLPPLGKLWIPYFGMGLLNNAIPFTAIFYAQTHISVSLASIVNATTPIFTFVILALFGDEPLKRNKILGSIAGVIGVAILFDPTQLSWDNTAFGIVLGLSAALSYGFSGLWAKRKMAGAKPLPTATGQLISSSIIMLVALPFLGVTLPDQLPSQEVLISLVGLAVFSTAFAYVIFFDLIGKSGASNAMLVTLLVPVSASFLGWLFMDDRLSLNQLAGALVIALALLIIDGRLFRTGSNLKSKSDI